MNIFNVNMKLEIGKQTEYSTHMIIALTYALKFKFDRCHKATDVVLNIKCNDEIVKNVSLLHVLLLDRMFNFTYNSIEHILEFDDNTKVIDFVLQHKLVMDVTRLKDLVNFFGFTYFDSYYTSI